MNGTDSRPVQVYRVYIKATPQAIWEAITSPEWTEKYGYAARATYDPALHAGATYRGMANEGMLMAGSPEVAVDGEILEVDPRKLVQTWRLLMDPGIAQEGFTRLTYEITPGTDGVSKLTVTHDLEGAPKLAHLVSGGLEATGAGGGWTWILSDLKSLMETGSALPWQTPGQG